MVLLKPRTPILCGINSNYAHNLCIALILNSVFRSYLLGLFLGQPPTTPLHPLPPHPLLDTQRRRLLKGHAFLNNSFGSELGHFIAISCWQLFKPVESKRKPQTLYDLSSNVIYIFFLKMDKLWCSKIVIHGKTVQQIVSGKEKMQRIIFRQELHPLSYLATGYRTRLTTTPYPP